jgi:hemolysin III
VITIAETFPVWRGRLHWWAFVGALPAGALLILAAGPAAHRASASIYVASLLAVFGTSAAYHRLARSGRTRRIMRQLDHSMIYVLITGSYVPLCLVALPPGWGISILSVVGGCALLGMSLKLAAFDRWRWLGDALYPLMGWVAVVATPVLVDRLTGVETVLLAAGGVIYTAGLAVLMTRRPDPWPATFGYHEVWHVFTVLAAACHFAVVTSILA